MGYSIGTKEGVIILLLISAYFVIYGFPDFGPATIWLSQFGELGGNITILVTSILGSLVFIPLSAQAFFPIALAMGANIVSIVIWAGIGALIGSIINYAIGKYSRTYATKYVSQHEIDKFGRLLSKYGWVGLFIVLALPIPFIDVITVACGLVGMGFIQFSFAVLLGHLVRNAIVLGIFALVATPTGYNVVIHL